MADKISTIQTGIKSHTDNSLTDYALFMGGTNVTHEVLKAYDPLKTGYVRIFMIRKPLFLDDTIPDKLTKFKHILEYGNTTITGLNDVTVQTQEIRAGYTGRSFDIPTHATDDTNSFTITCYEFSGSPIREVIHTWINGTSDLLTGLTHYNGSTVAKSQANQTAEFIYVATDNSGEKVEYACLFANCFPKNIKNDQFNYSSGDHNLVEYAIDFTCVKYESLQINKVAQKLIDKYKLLSNSLNFFSGVKSTDDETLGEGLGYDVTSGKMTADAKSKKTNSPMSSTDLASL